jgi:hypothetical protein
MWSAAVLFALICERAASLAMSAFSDQEKIEVQRHDYDIRFESP